MTYDALSTLCLHALLHTALLQSQADTKISCAVVPNDLYYLDLETRIWVEVNSSSMRGNVPEARALHSMTAVSDKLYVFGGLNAEYSICPTLMMLLIKQLLDDTEVSLNRSLERLEDV